MTILVTGFNRFGDLAFNPTQALVEQMITDPPPTSGEELRCHVLPTEYDTAANQIGALIRDIKPCLVLGFGVSTKRGKVCLERFALNLDDAAIEDNSGCTRRGEEIERGGPAALQTTVDIAAVLKRLVDEGVRAEISNHAGTFVCNHAYYRALRTLETQRFQAGCLFVHVPMPVPGAASHQASANAPWRMADLMQAARWILAELVRQRRAGC